MKKKFREAGYYLPEIVFWNIAGETTPTGTLPARADQPGVQLLSGYSASIMKTFLRGDLDNALKKSGPREEAVKSEAGEAKLASRPERKEAHDKSNPFTLATARAKLAQILDDPVFSKLRVVD